MRKFLKMLGAFILIFSPTLFFAPGFAQEAVYTDNLYDVKAVGEKVWIVGYHGTIFHSKDRGENWELQKNSTNKALFSLSMVGEKKGWAVGSDGTVVHTDDGKIWNTQSSNTGQHLFDVIFLDEKKGFVSGAEGTILYTKDGGKVWEGRSIQEDIDFYSICFADQNHGWTTGEFGVIFHTEDGGKTWKKQKSPIEISIVSGESQCLFKIRFKDKKTGYAIGIDGVMLYTSDGGESWKILPAVTKEHLFDISFINEEALTVGLMGTAVFTGVDTLPLDLGVKVDLNGVCYGHNGPGFIVGNKGTIFRSSDGGKRWETITIKGRNK